MGLTWNDVVNSYFELQNIQLLAKITVAVTIGVTIHQSVKYFQSEALRKRRANYKKDVVILHQFQRGTFTPSISPYCLKLETYLRLANIPYENDLKNWKGPLGKAPWITYNGNDIPDSRQCIEYLNKKFNVNLNSKLSVEERAVGHMFVMAIENHTGWIMARHRWVYEDYRYTTQLMNFEMVWPLTWLLHSMIGRKVDAATKAIGIGKHSRETLFQFAKEDLKQLSSYLGEKKFFFGDTVSEYDCSLFGWISMCVWCSPGTQFEELVNGDFENLKDYCLRMKALCWPDWESCITK